MKRGCSARLTCPGLLNEAGRVCRLDASTGFPETHKLCPVQARRIANPPRDTILSTWPALGPWDKSSSCRNRRKHDPSWRTVLQGHQVSSNNREVFGSRVPAFLKLPDRSDRNLPPAPFDRITFPKHPGLAEQPSRFVRIPLAERDNRAARKEAPELNLLWRAADLCHHRGRNQRKNAEFQTGLVFGPCPPFVPVRCHENRGVVHNFGHAGRRAVREDDNCALTLRRASSISSGLNRPCSFSHRATAAKPARRRSASRAATVIQAETLTRSRAAAIRMFL